jgi:hypothetical protein
MTGRWFLILMALFALLAAGAALFHGAGASPADVLISHGR